MPKLDANRARDEKALRHLQALGWDVLVIWQCEMSDKDELFNRLIDFVDDPKKPIDK